MLLHICNEQKATFWLLSEIEKLPEGFEKLVRQETFPTLHQRGRNAVCRTGQLVFLYVLSPCLAR